MNIRQRFNQDKLTSFQNLRSILNPEHEGFTELEDFKALIRYYFLLKGNPDNKDFWIAFEAEHKDYLSTAIESMHDGACVGNDSICNRCLAERLYEVPNSMYLDASHGHIAFNNYKRLASELKDDFRNLEEKTRVSKEDLQKFFTKKSDDIKKHDDKVLEKITDRIEYILNDKHYAYLDADLRIAYTFPNDMGGDFGDGGWPVLNERGNVSVLPVLYKKQDYKKMGSLDIPLIFFKEYNFELQGIKDSQVKHALQSYG